jgi:hypothetical protein
MSFVDSIAGNNGEKVFLVTGNENGRSAWYYVQVARKRLPYYENAIKDGNLDLRDFGDILNAGWGEEPPEEVACKMKELYN